MFGPVLLKPISALLRCARYIARSSTLSAVIMNARLRWPLRRKVCCQNLEPYFRGMVKATSKSEEIKAAGGATGPNDYSIWLKHGTLNGVRTENAIIPDEERRRLVYRAISKFNTVYDDRSPQMESFCRVGKRLADERRNACYGFVG